MLYTLTGFTTFYGLYIGMLKATIALAVAMSVLVSLDRLYKVVAFLGVSISQWRTGESLPLMPLDPFVLHVCKEDLPVLCGHFLGAYSQEQSLPAVVLCCK